MAYKISLPVFKDERGDLAVIENLLPFKIKRIFFIYNAKGCRGGHRHKKTIQALICTSGICNVFVNDNNLKENFLLNSPDQCLILNPQDWHTMSGFKNNATLFIAASEYYDPEDYITEPY